ncbi:MAG: hypothetical protein ACM3SY_04330 [Candidatus Omnitrophota bacterium]
MPNGIVSKGQQFVFLVLQQTRILGNGSSILAKYRIILRVNLAKNRIISRVNLANYPVSRYILSNERNKKKKIG